MALDWYARRTQPTVQHSGVFAAGLSLLLHAGGGLYWLVPGILFLLIAGIFHAWVLLVEILR